MNTPSPHIVFLTPIFAASENDSIAIPALQVYLKTIRIALPNYEMTLLSFQIPQKSTSYLWHGIKVIPLNGQMKRLKKPLIWRRAFKILEKLYHKNKITIIHSFWIGECSRIGLKFSQKYNTKHLVTVMGQDARPGNFYANALQNTKTKIVTLCNNQHNELLKNYGLKSVIIPHFIELYEYPDLQQISIDLLGVGSLIELKNYSLFINIISELVNKYPNIKAEIIGGGPQYNQLKSLIAENKLTNNITLTNTLSRAEVLQKMAKSKILLHTSDYEGFGYVFIEALYSGMQIVSKNVGFAQTASHWKISDTKATMVQSCDSILSLAFDRKRIEISKKENSINSYLELYNA